MNKDIVQGKWTQLKGAVKAEWGKLTDDELDQINGNSEMLTGRIQEIYGLTRDEARKRVNVWLSKHNDDQIK